MAIGRLIELIAPPLCAACGAAAGRLEALWTSCRRGLRWLAEAVQVGGVPAWAPVAYEAPARGLVTALKFRGASGAADAMASQIAANAPPGTLVAGHLVPVPLHPRRLRKRGFNQAERLAGPIADPAGPPAAA